MVAPHRLLAIPALLLALSACGTETDEPDAAAPASSAPVSSSPTSDLPLCEEIWVADQNLPAKYDGCFDGSVEVPADARECSIGKPIVTYADEFYAVPGKVVNHEEEGLDASEAYQSALSSCTG